MKAALMVALLAGGAACSRQQPAAADTHSGTAHQGAAEPNGGLAAPPMPFSTASSEQQAPSGQEKTRPVPPSEAGEAAHQDHDSKHGGTFFMALDEKHHLEGVLLSPGTFRVYLYQEHSRPLPKEDVARASARAVWGEQDHAPEIPMKPAPDGLALEATMPGVGTPSGGGAGGGTIGAAAGTIGGAPVKINLPIEITLLIHFPGAPRASRPELFTFSFKEFTRLPGPHKH